MNKHEPPANVRVAPASVPAARARAVDNQRFAFPLAALRVATGTEAGATQRFGSAVGNVVANPLADDAPARR
jgi:hypothetical protein